MNRRLQLKRTLETHSYIIGQMAMNPSCRADDLMSALETQENLQHNLSLMNCDCSMRDEKDGLCQNCGGETYE